MNMNLQDRKFQGAIIIFALVMIVYFAYGGIGTTESIQEDKLPSASQASVGVTILPSAESGEVPSGGEINGEAS
jgi:hypothetical protein